MVSRVLPRLQTLLPAVVLLIVCGILPSTVVHARTPYTYTDHSEGDPGDGVLDPAIEDDGDGSSGKKVDLVIQTGGSASLTGWLLPLGDLSLIPVYLPGHLSGQSMVFFKSTWLNPGSSPFSHQGRWNNAP